MQQGDLGHLGLDDCEEDMVRMLALEICMAHGWSRTLAQLRTVAVVILLSYLGGVIAVSKQRLLAAVSLVTYREELCELRVV